VKGSQVQILSSRPASRRSQAVFSAMGRRPSSCPGARAPDHPSARYGNFRRECPGCCGPCCLTFPRKQPSRAPDPAPPSRKRGVQRVRVTCGCRPVSASTRKRRRPRGARRTRALVALALLASTLAACGDDGGSGRPTLNWYNFPDDSGALQTAADRCSKASGGRYRINYSKLPRGADDQRQQLVRRLAAEDDSIDIMGLDVTWAAEFAEARWIREWTGENKRRATEGTLEVPLRTATWKDKLYAVPYNTNTQLLWYRKDLVPTPPKTWDEMLKMAGDLARQGKPHYVEIQGAQYEGLTVWFNSLANSAGGSILNASATDPSLGPPAVRAATIMRDLANSPAADPSLPNQMEDQNRLAMESGVAAFEINYPFVYPSMKANNPELFKNF